MAGLVPFLDISSNSGNLRSISKSIYKKFIRFV